MFMFKSIYWTLSFTMHGRLKVRTTAEQQEAKRKEREKKLKIYLAATSKIFKKKASGEYDDEALAITGEVLSSIPDFSSLWNYRREIFEAWIAERSSEDLKPIFVDELSFLESCLRVNPKSYGTWHHREWVLVHMPDPDWKREIMLCNKFLEFDERNFHCWDYRRIVVKRSNVSASDEFEFTTKKISTNFSNFSSWHYRSKLLPVLHPDPSQSLGVKEDVINEEYELVQNAFFTDPNDQSSWFYHKWLLGREEKPLSMESCLVLREQKRFVVRFSKPTKIVDDSLSVSIDAKGVALKWKSLGAKLSIMWVASIEDNLSNEDQHLISISLEGDKTCTCDLPAGSSISIWRCTDENAHVFQTTRSAATSKILTQEFESIQQLHELEPDNKWVLLTMLSLARTLDPIRYQDESREFLDKLRQVDPSRTNYYFDLESRYIVEDALGRTTDSHVDLSDMKLTALYHSDLLMTCASVDLSHNRLLSIKHAGYFQNCETLVLDGNQLTSLRDFKELRNLRTFSIKNNHLSDILEFRFLTGNTQLEVLDVRGNPVCAESNIGQHLTDLFPQLKKLEV